MSKGFSEAMRKLAERFGIWRKSHHIKNQADAGDVSIAVTLIARWEEFVDTLSPNFQMDGEKALQRVIPKTSLLEEALATRLSVTGGLDIAGVTPGRSGGSPQQAGAQGGGAGQLPAAPAGKPQPNLGAGGDANYPPATPPDKKPSAGTTDGSGGGQSLPNDPMLEYAAATAFYQEIQFLNRYVSEAALRSGYGAYVIRIQVSVVPFLRNLPYDVYTNLSFFPYGETEHGSDALKLPRERAEIIPLLVTDNLESVIKSRSTESVRQMLLSLEALQPSGKARAGVSGSRQHVEHSLASGLNSLLTVGRISDNTIQVRLGAQQSGAEYCVIPRTHNITVLGLIPLSYLKEAKEKKFRPMIRLLSNTVWRDARTGDKLEQQTPNERLSRVQQVLKGAGYSTEQQHDLADKLLYHVFVNDVPEFDKTLQEASLARTLRETGLPREIKQELPQKLRLAYRERFPERIQDLAEHLNIVIDPDAKILQTKADAPPNEFDEEFLALFGKIAPSSAYLRGLWVGLVSVDAGLAEFRRGELARALANYGLLENRGPEFIEELLFAVHMNDYQAFEQWLEEAFLDVAVARAFGEAESRNDVVRRLWLEAGETNKTLMADRRSAGAKVLAQLELSEMASDLERLLHLIDASEYSDFEEVLGSQDVFGKFLRRRWVTLRKEAEKPLYGRVVIENLKGLELSINDQGHFGEAGKTKLIAEYCDLESLAVTLDLEALLYRSLWSRFVGLSAPEEINLCEDLRKLELDGTFIRQLPLDQIESFACFKDRLKNEVFKTESAKLKLGVTHIRELWMRLVAPHAGPWDERLERIRMIVRWLRVPADHCERAARKLFDAAVLDDYDDFEDGLRDVVVETETKSSFRRELWGEFARDHRSNENTRERIGYLLRCLSVAPKDREEAVSSLMYAIENEDEESFQGLIDKFTLPVRFPRDVWSDITETLSASEYSGVRVELPPPQRNLPIQHQDVLVVDDGEQMTVFLQGGADLYEDRMSAILLVKPKKGGSLAIRSRKIEFGKKYPGLLITFPSIIAWGVVDELTLKDDHSLHAAELHVSHSTKDKWNPLNEIKRCYEPVSYVDNSKKKNTGTPQPNQQAPGSLQQNQQAQTS